jgi:hypothetical protein
MFAPYFERDTIAIAFAQGCAKHNEPAPGPWVIHHHVSNNEFVFAEQFLENPLGASDEDELMLVEKLGAIEPEMSLGR